MRAFASASGFSPGAPHRRKVERAVTTVGPSTGVCTRPDRPAAFDPRDFSRMVDYAQTMITLQVMAQRSRTDPPDLSWPTVVDLSLDAYQDARIRAAAATSIRTRELVGSI